MTQIHPGFYQFTIAIPEMNITIHQYLLEAEDPLVAVIEAVAADRINILPEKKAILNGKSPTWSIISAAVLLCVSWGNSDLFHTRHQQAFLVPLCRKQAMIFPAMY